jgi:hypothetical protein
MAQDEAYATTVVHNTLLAVWSGAPTAARVDVLGEQLREIADRNQSRVFLYNVITHSATVPDAAAREALKKHFVAMRGSLVACAIVLEKTGIEGTLSRTVLSTLVTITRQPFPLRLFAVRRDAASWLVTQGCVTTGGMLTSLAESLELRMREHRAA